MQLLTLLLLVPSCVLSNKSVEYLQYYGYVNEGDLTVDITSAITLFQETFNLTIDGTFNNETLTLMEQPRCGNKDEVLPFSADPNVKWKNTTISWYMYGDTSHIGLVERAFNLWEKHADLRFTRVAKEPTIYVSMSSRIHVYFANSSSCLYQFHGPGGVLAHAFLPYHFVKHTDIHMDKEENWDYTLNIPTGNSISFYLVLVHEIGHALGLQHSYVKTAAMYPYYSVPSGISSLEEYDLDKDDINAVQFLYGLPTLSTTTMVPSTSTSSTSTTTTTPSTPEATVTELDLCSYKNEINTFFILKDKLYVFYKVYAWVLPVEPSRRTAQDLKHPYVIPQWLQFLPRNLTRIIAVYQKRQEEVVLFVDNYAYFVSIPSFTLNRKSLISSVLGRNFKTINTAFQSYTGRVFILYDDKFVAEIDECNRWARFIGTTSDIFESIPGTLTGAFRYTNGNLYFITASHTLEYNEFTRIVNRSFVNVFEVLQITCIRESLINQLYGVLRYLQ